MTSYHIDREKLPAILPIFPLTGTLLLPGGQLPLNIFEPRYLAMVQDSLQTQTRLIGMVQPRVPNEEDNIGAALDNLSDEPEIYTTGCAGKIISFTESSDGRFFITLFGITRFKILEEEQPRDGYRRIKPDYRSFPLDQNDAGTPLSINRSEFLEKLKKYFNFRKIRVNWENIEKAELTQLVTSLAMSIPFSPVERQALLEANSNEDRVALLLAMMEMAGLSVGGQSEISH
ncbi:MAG: LON peptidase substrate-binding domain-containing protein [Pseudomonadota bacterium]|nr:LON peptidase substrate-binding domain-containing protein [Pseudomonadota bacterium]